MYETIQDSGIGNKLKFATMISTILKSKCIPLEVCSQASNVHSTRPKVDEI